MVEIVVDYTIVVYNDGKKLVPRPPGAQVVAPVSEEPSGVSLVVL